ncbi:extracellular solute-binding protein [Luteibaculum oceani]|uniref:Extracellular solute-binding protein n=1 Tax=Luteibaculum oceani TaxID=1294296 RepID=A0A5C6VDD7_9FLAO|nr:extracellular solute-binding protein [Luteibaculum oceani]TXC81655.1 extracellular solute-binding protein [Luteibaculum oceani]
MKNIFPLIIVAISFLFGACTQQEEKVVNLYTHRHYDVDKMIFEKFQKETGIKVNVVSASADELITKIKQEGELSPADLLITVDAGKIERAKQDGLLQSANSDVLNQQILAPYRDSENYWFGISSRARIIAVSKSYENPESLTYGDLASDAWQGKVLMRSSDNIYNQSLVAAIIGNVGEDSAMKWVAAVHGNLARDPKGNDRDQVRAIAAGEGEITVVNSYYIGKMANSDQENDRNAIEKVNFVFPSDANLNTHVNISAAGLLKHAPNKENAVKLLEFITRADNQELIYTENQEYPVNTLKPAEQFFTPVGEFEIDDLPLSELGAHQNKAVSFFEKAGWM